MGVPFRCAAPVMALDDRVDAWVTLAHKALPQHALTALLGAFSEPRSVLNAPRSRLAAVVPAAVVERVLAPAQSAPLEATRAWLTLPGHGIVAWDDADYPRALFDIGDAPPVLFIVGRRDLLNRPSLAIVGSRQATAQGIANARAFAAALSAAGLTIVSGLALGIDAAAHRGALESPGSTIAVVGTGLDRVYPARHRELAHAIAAQGTLVSEFTPGTPPLKEHFPRRNRLISGLARGVLVIEATLSSGSLITARLAGEQGRDVFAVPGSIHSPFSKGPHRLIREGAKLVETAQDVMEEMHVAVPSPPAAASREAPPAPIHLTLLDAMAHDPVGVDALIERTGLAAGAIAAALTELELRDQVAALPGGRWQRIARA
jgi:DNA processing protein